MTTNTNPTNKGTAGNDASLLPYHYYVLALDLLPGGIRSMEIEISRARPIRTMNDVQDPKRWLRSEYGCVNPQVSFSLLRNDLAGRRGKS